MLKEYNNSYTTNTKLDQNAWITDPRIPDPENLPEPLGWCVLVRPYPVDQNKEKSKLILPDSEKDFLNYVTNIGRVVKMGPCCYSRPEHRDKDGNQFDWVKVGDFVSFPKNVGARRKFKGVGYIMLVDDEIVEKLPDPQVFDNSMWKIDIPEEDLKTYNSIYKEDKKND